MNKLSKPKAFEASESITTQSGIEIANLLRSGIKNQTVILVANNQKWHEIEIETLRIDEENFLENSHLESAAHYIEVNKISLSDMGIIEEEIKIDYDLKHEDFLELSKTFPGYDETQIFKLHEYEKRNGLPHGKYHKKETLRMLTERKITINDYIREVENRKHAIINETEEHAPQIYNEFNEVINVDLSNEAYSAVVDESKPQHAIVVDTVPVPVPTDSVSLQIFEKLTPEKITELQGLRVTQEEIVKANQVVIIKDKKTYAEAKRVAAILLSASTVIDGSKGVEATATKYLNTFKTMLKTALLPIAKLTREPYDKQKKLIEDWDNRLLLQAQNRVKELFAVPFTFNSETDSYSVGSLVITQKDIEDKNDSDFAALVSQGKAIIIALESVKSEQDSKIAAQEKQIAELKALIEKLLPTTAITEGVHIPLENPFEPVAEIKTPDPSGNYSIQEQVYNSITKLDTEDTDNVFASVKEYSGYSLPHPDNKLLNDLDLAHVSVLEEKQYIECREYYAQALSDASDSINDILVNPDKTIQKSVAITELIKTWKL